MRNKNKMLMFLGLLADYWIKVPHMRFGQLMYNFQRWLKIRDKGIYYMPDEELMENFKAYVTELEKGSTTWTVI